MHIYVIYVYLIRYVCKIILFKYVETLIEYKEKERGSPNEYPAKCFDINYGFYSFRSLTDFVNDQVICVNYHKLSSRKLISKCVFSFDICTRFSIRE